MVAVRAGSTDLHRGWWRGLHSRDPSLVASWETGCGGDAPMEAHPEASTAESVSLQVVGMGKEGRGEGEVEGGGPGARIIG